MSYCQSASQISVQWSIFAVANEILMEFYDFISYGPCEIGNKKSS